MLGQGEALAARVCRRVVRNLAYTLGQAICASVFVTETLGGEKVSNQARPILTRSAYPPIPTAYTHISTRSNEARGDGSHGLGGCLGFDGGERACKVRRKRESLKREEREPPRRTRCVCVCVCVIRGGRPARSAKVSMA
jgi:hypothetical protein